MTTVPEIFGSMVFDSRVMKARLSGEVYPNCAASPSNETVMRRSPAFMAASSIASVLLLVILEERHHNGAGTCMRPDHAAHRCVTDFFQVTLPDMAAILDVL